MLNVKKILLTSILSLVFVLLCTSASYADAGIFTDLSDRTTDFAVGLRNLAYVISGFGIVMFTFLAIGGKINFKHLGYIVLCLFMLSAVGSIIWYLTDGAPQRAGLQLEGNNAFGTQYKKAGEGKFSGNSSL